MRQFFVIFLFAIIALSATAQYVVLPDSVFSQGDIMNELPELPTTSTNYLEPLFRATPAVTLDDYVVSPSPSQSYFYDLPETPSQFYMHMLVLHLSRIDVPGLEEEMARYNLMLENFTGNLYSGGGYTLPYVPSIYSDTRSSTFVSAGGGFTVYSGCLDPLEAYRNWVQERRLMRAKAIIRDLEGYQPLDPAAVEPSSLKLPDNLLQENNYDVKVKKSGDDPPYRP